MSRTLALSLLVLVPSIAGSRAHASCHDRDEDQDGINSCDDLCPDTPPGQSVDHRGCSCTVNDEDGDGIVDCEDACPGADDRLDADGDGIRDCLDLCPGTRPGAAADRHGCTDVFPSWESPHVHPLELTPDHARLLAVNTGAHRLEVFEIGSSGLLHVAAIPVGLEPVTVRARTASEAWVVNSISDSISIVDLDSGSVRATILTGDEPADVVFAGEPPRAFISIAQAHRLEVRDPLQPDAPPVLLPLEGNRPRSLASDGTRVYVAFHASGNSTTVLDAATVSSLDGPYGGRNPPPNRGESFEPPLGPGNPSPPPAGLIVRRDADGRWLDDNGRDWSSRLAGSVAPDRDLAIVEAKTLVSTYAGGGLTTCTALAARADGKVTVVGTEARNEVRFEPHVRGRFIRVAMELFDAGSPGAPTAIDLNPHLDYASTTTTAAERRRSLGDPRAIVWHSDGSQGYVSGMGSGTIIVVGPEGQRRAQVEVGSGPTGLALDEPRQRLYVLHRFDASIGVIDARSATQVSRVRFFDPTPPPLQAGRRLFYGTRRTSGLGQAACASCHVDARTDDLGWDLGDPGGAMQPFDQECSGDTHPCSEWHPMKGPLLTQSLVGALGSEPFHWRGDRTGLAAFNPAFVDLLGGDRQLTPAEMDELTAFLSSIAVPPNPHLGLDGTLKESLANGGNPRAGATLFGSREIHCDSCHAGADGSKRQVLASELLRQPQQLNVPRLVGLHERTRVEPAPAQRRRGFGFAHDGSAASIFELLQLRGIDHSARPAVLFPDDAAGRQSIRDLEAFLLSFPGATHSAVGAQVTIGNLDTAPPALVARLGIMSRLVQDGAVGMVAWRLAGGKLRGYASGARGVLLEDRAGESTTLPALLESAGFGSEVTFTLVPAGAQLRLAIDRDADGFLDGDELDRCSDPEDPTSTPEAAHGCPEAAPFRRGDVDGNGAHEITDAVGALAYLFNGATAPSCLKSADADDSGGLEITDAVYLLGFLFLGGPAPPPPFAACGADPSADALTCESVSRCETLPGVIVSSVGMRMVLIPAGSFLMGSAASERDRELDGGQEDPVHRVHITRPFYIGSTEVTQSQFEMVTGRQPSHFAGCGDCPVESVSWFEAEELCNLLTAREGRTYRLPTEAEWEYAARAGSTTRFHFGDASTCFSGCDPCPILDEHAWWCHNAERRTHPVATRQPNAWGVFDMHGNVYEWCQDWYGSYPSAEVDDPSGPRFGSVKVLRGGDYGTPLHACRSAVRTNTACCAPDLRSRGTGLRVVLEVDR